MNVYVVHHEDSDYDSCSSEIRGVFDTREAAEASLVTRTPAGARSRAWDAHKESCCSVREWEVQTLPRPDVQHDPQPFAGPSAGQLIPDALVDDLIRFASSASRGLP